MCNLEKLNLIDCPSTSIVHGLENLYIVSTSTTQILGGFPNRFDCFARKNARIGRDSPFELRRFFAPPSFIERLTEPSDLNFSVICGGLSEPARREAENW
jgi:hypothetical protein